MKSSTNYKSVETFYFASILNKIYLQLPYGKVKSYQIIQCQREKEKEKKTTMCLNVKLEPHFRTE